LIDPSEARVNNCTSGVSRFCPSCEQRFLSFSAEMPDIQEHFMPRTVPELADEASLSLIPKTSGAKYEQEYDKFILWCKTKGTADGDCSETVILAYLYELSSRYAPSSLWCKYSMLHKLIGIRNGVDIGTYSTVRAYLKVHSTGHIAKKSSVFTHEQINQFLNEANDNDFLHLKVVALFSLYGVCRKSEILSMTIDDIKDVGEHLLVNIPASKTGPRSFVLVPAKEASLCVLSNFRRYLKVRPANAPSRLFLGYRGGKCTRQAIGINTLSAFPKKIAEFLKLDSPSSYTSHAFRRSAATWMADNGIDLINLKRFGGWRSDSVAQAYVAESVGNKTKIAKLLNEDSTVRSANLTITETVQSSYEKPTIEVSAYNNCNFNIHINQNNI
jgi:integrase